MTTQSSSSPSQFELPQPQSSGRRRISRRKLLVFGGGGVAALGLGGFASWQYARSPRRIQRMDREVIAVAWSPDSRHFVATDTTGIMTVWTVGGQQVYSQSTFDSENNTWPSLIAWSPNGKYLALGGSSVHIWNAQSGGLLSSFPNVVGTVVAWSPDSKRIASGGAFGKIQIWEPESGRVQLIVQAYKNTEGEVVIISLAWSPDGSHIVALGPHQGDFLAFWNTTTGEATLLPFNEPVDELFPNFINSIAWSPDGKHVAAAYHSEDKGRVALWSRQEQGRSWSYDGSVTAHFWVVYEISWSPDSTHFATVGQDNKIQIWSTSNKTLLNTSTTSDPDANYGEGFHFYALQALGWSPDGKYLLAGDSAGQVWLWMVG
jgi:WD40 repeat protein